MNQADMKKLLEMGIRLSTERDMDDLLAYIRPLAKLSRAIKIADASD